MPTVDTWNTGSTLAKEAQPGPGLSGNVCEAALAQGNLWPPLGVYVYGSRGVWTTGPRNRLLTIGQHLSKSVTELTCPVTSPLFIFSKFIFLSMLQRHLGRQVIV